MIIRIIGDNFYEVDEHLADQFFDLDICVDSALASGDETAFRTALVNITEAIQRHGSLVSKEMHMPADIVVPSIETSLEQFRVQMDAEAFED